MEQVIQWQQTDKTEVLDALFASIYIKKVSWSSCLKKGLEVEENDQK